MIIIKDHTTVIYIRHVYSQEDMAVLI